MKTTFASSNKDNTGSTILLASIFILVASAVFTTGNATAKVEATPSITPAAAASETLLVTATRLK